MWILLSVLNQQLGKLKRCRPLTSRGVIKMTLNEQQPADQEWMERTGLDQDSLCGAIETMIFMSDRPISIRKLRDRLDKEIPLEVIHQGLHRLQQDYEQPHHGIRLMEVGEGLQFRTKATYARFVQDIFKPSALILGPVALEVLAIVAYRQPVARAEIDKTRGVDSSHILRTLMDKRLVQVSGRSEDAGRPVVYGTTNEFLEMFNLTQLADLPPEHELNALSDNQDVGEIADIKELVSSSAEFHDKFNFDEMEELDELAKTIKEVNPHTAFTQSIKQEEKKRQDSQKNAYQSTFELLEEFVSSNRSGPSPHRPHEENGPDQQAADSKTQSLPITERPAMQEGPRSDEAKLEADLNQALDQLTGESGTAKVTETAEIAEDFTAGQSLEPPSQDLV